jgi:hypothetical protein
MWTAVSSAVPSMIYGGTVVQTYTIIARKKFLADRDGQDRARREENDSARYEISRSASRPANQPSSVVIQHQTGVRVPNAKSGAGVHTETALLTVKKQPPLLFAAVVYRARTTRPGGLNGFRETHETTPSPRTDASVSRSQHI